MDKIAILEKDKELAGGNDLLRKSIAKPNTLRDQHDPMRDNPGSYLNEVNKYKILFGFIFY